MKKLMLTAVLAAAAAIASPFCALAATWQDSASTAWYSSGVAGSEADPYVIESAADLAGLAKLVNVDKISFKDKFVVLSRDIDLRDIEWVPIGWDISASENFGFGGTFDGRGHSIVGMVITKVSYQTSGSPTPRSDAVGLFGYLTNDAIVKGLFVDGRISGNDTSFAGMLTGYSAPKLVENCVVSGEIVNAGGAAYGGNSYVGGFGGSDGRGSYKNCVSLGSYTANGDAQNYAAGIIGYASNSSGATTFTNCVGAASRVAKTGGSLGVPAGIAAGLVSSPGSGNFWLSRPGADGQPEGAMYPADSVRCESETELPISAALLSRVDAIKIRDAGSAQTDLQVALFPSQGTGSPSVTWDFTGTDVAVGGSGRSVKIASPTPGEKQYKVTISGVRGLSPITLHGTVRFASEADKTAARQKMTASTPEWTGSGSASFTSSLAFDKFIGVQIDGAVIAPSGYTASSGSTRIELLQHYLATLADGEHTIRIIFEGGFAESSFTKKTQAPPQSGGGGGGGGCSAGTALAAAAALAIMARRKS